MATAGALSAGGQQNHDQYGPMERGSGAFRQASPPPPAAAAGGTAQCDINPS